MGLAFAVFVYFAYEGKWFGLGTVADAVDGLANNGTSAMEKYLTGYIVEKSLSVDNIFVISMIFSFFAVPALYQHRVLFWGILGALLLRGVMIALGAKLIAEFHWVLYLFAGFLIVTAIKMLFLKSENTDPNTADTGGRLRTASRWKMGHIRSGTAGAAASDVLLGLGKGGCSTAEGAPGLGNAC